MDCADNVSKELPEDAIAIWHGLIKANLGKVGNSYYDQIGKALKCMRPVMEQQGKRSEWDALISELRQTEKSKRNLMKAGISPPFEKATEPLQSLARFSQSQRVLFRSSKYPLRISS